MTTGLPIPIKLALVSPGNQFPQPAPAWLVSNNALGDEFDRAMVTGDEGLLLVQTAGFACAATVIAVAFGACGWLPGTSRRSWMAVLVLPVSALAAILFSRPRYACARPGNRISVAYIAEPSSVEVAFVSVTALLSATLFAVAVILSKMQRHGSDRDAVARGQGVRGALKLALTTTALLLGVAGLSLPAVAYVVWNAPLPRSNIFGTPTVVMVSQRSLLVVFFHQNL